MESRVGLLCARRREPVEHAAVSPFHMLTVLPRPRPPPPIPPGPPPRLSWPQPPTLQRLVVKNQVKVSPQHPAVKLVDLAVRPRLPGLSRPHLSLQQHAQPEPRRQLGERADDVERRHPAWDTTAAYNGRLGERPPARVAVCGEGSGVSKLEWVEAVSPSAATPSLPGMCRSAMVPWFCDRQCRQFR